MLRILIVNDYHLVVECLTGLINGKQKRAAISEVADYDAALALLNTEIFDIVIIEAVINAKNAIPCLRAIKKTYPTLPILVLSGYSEHLYAENCINAGAASYLTLKAHSGELVSAIWQLAVGERYITPEVGCILAESLVKRKTRRADRALLSSRELEVIQLLAYGYTSSQIAERLCLSSKTVGTYRARIQEKTGCHTTLEIIRYAFKENLVV